MKFQNCKMVLKDRAVNILFCFEFVVGFFAGVVEFWVFFFPIDSTRKN